MCKANDGIEDVEHFLLLCPSFDTARRDLLSGVFDAFRLLEYSNLPNDVLVQILLYGDKNLPDYLI